MPSNMSRACPVAARWTTSPWALGSVTRVAAHVQLSLRGWMKRSSGTPAAEAKARGTCAPADVDRPPRVPRVHVGERRAGRLGPVLGDQPSAGVAEGAEDRELGHDPELPVRRDPRLRPFVARERARGEGGFGADGVAEPWRSRERRRALSGACPHPARSASASMVAMAARAA